MPPANAIAIGRRDTRRSRERSMNGIPIMSTIQIVGMMIVPSSTRFGLSKIRRSWKRKK